MKLISLVMRFLKDAPTASCITNEGTIFFLSSAMTVNFYVIHAMLPGSLSLPFWMMMTNQTGKNEVTNCKQNKEWHH